jgi:nucleoid-associated protein YgaU
LAEKEYTYSTDWPAIWLATNARAGIDDSISFIADPNRIEIGQKVWIPGDIDFEYLPPPQ